MRNNMQFEKTPGWLDWYNGPTKPKFQLPAGAVDAHCHVFGPGNEFPYAPERKYTPCGCKRLAMALITVPWSMPWLTLAVKHAV